MVRPKNLGMTLIEVLVSFSLVGIVLYGAHQLLTNGIRYYTESMEALDVQREALGALERISSQIGRTNRAQIKWIPDPDITADPKEAALIYPSVLDVNGRFQTDDEGRLLWQGISCFYQAQVNGIDVLLSKYAPLGGGPVDSPPNAYTQAPPLDLAYFIGAGGGGVVASHVEVFDVRLQPDLVEFDLVVEINSIAGRKYKAGSPNAVNRFKITSRAYPRN